MLQMTAEGRVVAVKRFKTTQGGEAISFKLECVMDDGRYKRKQQCIAYGADKIAQIGNIKVGETIKVQGVPRAKCMIGEDGSPFAWLELSGAKRVYGNNERGYQDAQTPEYVDDDDIPF